MASSAAERIILFLARSGYYISLLGLKIPCALLIRASRAPRVLAFILFAWIPFLIYCHTILLPAVPDLPLESATMIWHLATALWVTIPIAVVGCVILSVVSVAAPYIIFLCAFGLMLGFHGYGIPLIAKTQFGGVMLQLMFAFFEDLPIAGWVWCLVHVVRLQRHIAKTQGNRASPLSRSGKNADRVLVVGNAPTVIEGSPLGKVIDEFKHVIRFNTYNLSKPEWTGTKVDFHFCNGRNFPTSDKVVGVCPLFNASLTHAVYLFMPHMEDAKAIFERMMDPKVNAYFVPEDEILDLRRTLGVKVWQIPTSGAIAINTCLKNEQEVTLHGFNFFTSKKIHYFEESAVHLLTSWLERFVTHEPSLEKRWVERMIVEGKTKFLASVPPSAVDSSTEDQCYQVVCGEKGEDDESELRRRTPGLVHTLLKDGFPSQFSL